MLRYSLGSLFLVLLYLSVGCAALVNASGVWQQVTVTLTLAILVLFSLGAIFLTEPRRVKSPYRNVSLICAVIVDVSPDKPVEILLGNHCI